MIDPATGWGWLPEAGLDEWLTSVNPVARRIASDPEARAAWLRHGETWFAGVNVLPNDASGAVANGPPLPPAVMAAAEAVLGQPPAWDAGQLSVVYPGYPRRDAEESEGNHRFRKLRDAAHVDGLLPVGTERRRKMQEPHAFVLGIPLNTTGPGASPMVVWEGSHEVMRAAFRAALAGVPEEAWGDVDLTEVYQAARRRCFERCRRVPVHAQPGEAYLIHRLALHGVAPWEEGAEAPEAGRMIVYFRPAFSGKLNWLDAP
ncbi:MAG: hypothetical protein AAFR53_03510 [Pseudomonadota bacterium]